MIRLLARLSVALYGVLLLRYPAGMRARFGRDMRRLFEQDLEARIRASGGRGLVDAWMRVVGDWLRPLPGPLEGGGGRVTVDDPAGRGGGIMGGGGTRWIEDLAFAWRSVRREPGFAALVVAVLGAGVALNAGVFAIVNAYLVRPLPYPEADRVVDLDAPIGLTWDDAEDILEKRVSWDLDAFTLVGGAGPQLARGAWVTPDFLEVYGVRPALGRIFSPDEGGPDGASVAVIGYGLWQRRWGGDPGVLGETFRAYTSDRPDDAETFTIVGVLPPDFWHFNDYTEVLAPLRQDRNLYAGRLREDIPLPRAQELLTERVRARVPDADPAQLRVEVRRQQDAHTASIRPTLWTLQAAVVLVFLIALANAAVLLLVRSARREREMAVRRALGAAGGRLARQLLAEGLLLTGLAAAVGVALAYAGLEALRGVEALTLWRTVPGGVAALRLDGTVLVATLALCAVTGFAFGLVPLLTVAWRDLAGSLAEGSRTGADTRGRRRVRNLMVGGEIALSLALLTGAGLMVRSAIHLQTQDLGFEPERVTRGVAGLRQASYPDPAARVLFFQELAERAGALPGVEATGLVNVVPTTWRFGTRELETELGGRGEAVVQIADGGYFSTLGIDVQRGRVFDERDALGTERVVVVSGSLAAQLWGDADPIGKQVRVVPFSMQGMAPSEPEPWSTVVGVVDDVWKGTGEVQAGHVYAPHAQVAPFWMNLVVRRRAGTGSPVAEIEGLLAALDTDVPFSSAEELANAVASATAPSRFLATLFAGFAGFALVLAVLGLYGVMSYAARQRRRDVAIRMALGADAASVRGLFVRQALVVLGGGLALGVVGGQRIGRALAGQLHGVEPGDPATLAVVVGLLGFTGLVAVWLPARRAATAAPMGVLRDD